MDMLKVETKESEKAFLVEATTITILLVPSWIC